MARVKKIDPTQRRLLSAWEPPFSAGAPVGVLATTFTLDTAHFEEECLARFAGVQSDAVRDGALYLIEREEKLSSLMCAAVVADIHHCKGRRSLRWNLLAARPKSGVMHAKISLLAWQEHVRIIIGSGNLTQEGYRRNQECFTLLDFDLKIADRGLLDPLLVYLRELLNLTQSPARKHAENLLDWVDQRLPKGFASSKGVQRHLILIGPGRQNLFDQLKPLLPDGSVETADVVSPFFDPDLRAKGPEAALWDLMRKRGPANVHFHVAGEEIDETGGWRLEVPAHVQKSKPGRDQATISFHPINVARAVTDFGIERRPLHAKTMQVSSDKWSALIIGSSNFTSAGTGLNQYARNFEANVVYVARGEQGSSVRNLMDSRLIRGGDVIGINEKVKFEPAFDPDAESIDPVPPLPAFFSDAELIAVDDFRYRLSLRFVQPEPKGDWTVSLDKKQVLHKNGWILRGQAEIVEVDVLREGPLPSSLDVQWSEDAHRSAWPVNVASASLLPLPEALKNLTLSALLDLLGSARPLHEALRAWLRRKPDDDDADPDLAAELIDPHAKVDTSGYLVKRVQRACWVIRELGARLSQPVLSESAMAWRIEGPVGVRAALSAMQKECLPQLPDQWIFVLCELWRELKGIRVASVGRRTPDPAVVEMFDTLVAEIDGTLRRTLPSGSRAMKAYVKAALQEVTHATA